MKGIILAAGKGTRLHPLTLTVSKQALPVYDKPMIYYPLSTLIYSGIREVLIISTPNDLPVFQQLLGDGSKFGCRFEYKIQPVPNGLAQAFILGEEFIGNDKVCLILGDNIFYGTGFSGLLKKCVEVVDNEKKAVVFGYEVKDPERYGVVEFNNDNMEVVSLDEKPKRPKSNYAVVGLYFYPNSVIEVAKNVKPSDRGELEITSVNNSFLQANKLKVELLARGFAWLDTGTIDAINNASNFIRTIEDRQGLKVSCLEEIAYLNGFIDKKDIKDLIKKLPNDYANYLCRLIDN